MPTRRRTHRKPVLAPDEKPDPIVDALTKGSADPERPADEVHKDATAGEAATGTPVAGRSTIAAVTGSRRSPVTKCGMRYHGSTMEPNLEWSGWGDHTTSAGRTPPS
jgi:hypothetical protein